MSLDNYTYAFVRKTLGPPGRLLGPSKGQWRTDHPDAKPVFNANVYLGADKVWYGDLDLADQDFMRKLQGLADANGLTVRVLEEMNGRFENEDKPVFSAAVAMIIPAMADAEAI